MCVTCAVLIDMMSDVKSIRLNRCCSEIRFKVCVFIFNFALSLTPECVSAFRHAHTHVYRIRASQDKRCCRRRPAAVIRLLSHTHNKSCDSSMEKCDWRWNVNDREEKKGHKERERQM